MVESQESAVLHAALDEDEEQVLIPSSRIPSGRAPRAAHGDGSD